MSAHKFFVELINIARHKYIDLKSFLWYSILVVETRPMRASREPFGINPSRKRYAMTSPLQPSYPHADLVVASLSAPAEDHAELDKLLRQRDEIEARILATHLKDAMSTPEGAAIILAALPMDEIRQIAHETADRAARHAIRTEPVPAHEHRAQRLGIRVDTRGLSRVGAVIGAVVGGLLAWLLVAHYTVTTVAFGTPHEMHSASVNWVRTAIVAVVVLFFALAGALIGPRKKQEQIVQADIRLGSQHMTRNGHVPTYQTIADTARHAPKDDK